MHFVPQMDLGLDILVHPNGFGIRCICSPKRIKHMKFFRKENPYRGLYVQAKTPTWLEELQDILDTGLKEKYDSNLRYKESLKRKVEEVFPAISEYLRNHARSGTKNGRIILKEFSTHLGAENRLHHNRDFAELLTLKLVDLGLMVTLHDTDGISDHGFYIRWTIPPKKVKE